MPHKFKKFGPISAVKDVNYGLVKIKMRAGKIKSYDNLIKMKSMCQSDGCWEEERDIVRLTSFSTANGPRIKTRIFTQGLIFHSTLVNARPFSRCVYTYISQSACSSRFFTIHCIKIFLVRWLLYFLNNRRVYFSSSFSFKEKCNFLLFK